MMLAFVGGAGGESEMAPRKGNLCKVIYLRLQIPYLFHHR